MSEPQQQPKPPTVLDRGREEIGLALDGYADGNPFGHDSPRAPVSAEPRDAMRETPSGESVRGILAGFTNVSPSADAARMEAIDNDLDDMRWVRPSHHPDGPLVELDWFVGDGGGTATTRGTTIRAAVDAYLAALAPAASSDPNPEGNRRE